MRPGERETEQNPNLSLVLFVLDGWTFGVEAGWVEQVLANPGLARTPGAPAHLKGILPAREGGIPVVDLHHLLGMKEASCTGSEAQLILLRAGKSRFAVGADSVKGMVRADSSEVEPVSFAPSGKGYVRGALEQDGVRSLVLNLQAMIEAGFAQNPWKPDAEFEGLREALKRHAGFFVSEANLAWIRRRWAGWLHRSGLHEINDKAAAALFLRGFASPCMEALWQSDLRDAVRGLLPRRLKGPFAVWNHQCGKGFDAYSLACILLSSFPDIRLTVWAEDSDAARVILAPDLLLPLDVVPRYLARSGLLVETPEGARFSDRVRRCVQFTLADRLPAVGDGRFDLVIARDVVSYSEPAAQRALLESFENSTKPNGLLILGSNEKPLSGRWTRIVQGGLRAHRRRADE